MKKKKLDLDFFFPHLIYGAFQHFGWYIRERFLDLNEKRNQGYSVEWNLSVLQFGTDPIENQHFLSLNGVLCWALSA